MGWLGDDGGLKCVRQDKDVPEDGTDGKATVTYLPYLTSYRDSAYVVGTLGSGHRIDVAFLASS